MRIIILAIPIAAFMFLSCTNENDSLNRRQLTGVWWLHPDAFSAAIWVMESDSINYVEEGTYPFELVGDSLFVYLDTPPDTIKYSVAFRGADTLLLTQNNYRIQYYRGTD